MDAYEHHDGGFVRTVCGDVSPEQVGFAHCHEHTFILPGPSCQVNADLLLDNLQRTTAELEQFHAAGGRTIVDAQPIGPERAPLLQKQASERSQVNIVATTGLHRACYYPPDHFRYRETAETLAQRMVDEVINGMVRFRDPEAVERTGVRAGMIKFATEYHVIDAEARKAAEAAAIAHRQTGAPILTHAERGTCAIEQIALVESLGVAPSALLISHLDRNPDVYLHEDVAAAGAYLVYDGISRTEHLPDSTIVELICRMVQSGHGDRILLAMDMGPRTMWTAYGGGPGMTYLAKVFLPKLRRAGLGQTEIDRLTVLNPAAALTFRVHNTRQKP